MKNAKNIFASVSGLALMGATALRGLAQPPPHVMAPPATGRFFAGKPAFVSGWIKVNPATFTYHHADCSAISVKYESFATGQMESTHGTGNAATGTCYYKLEVPHLTWPDAGQISAKFLSFSWGAARPVVVKPGEGISLNFSRVEIK